MKIITSKFNDEKETAKEVQLFRQYFQRKRMRSDNEVHTVDLTKDGG
jgi:hypothetical protein